MHLTRTLTAALLGLALAATPAAAFDYTYLEGGIAHANGDSPDRDAWYVVVAMGLENTPAWSSCVM